VTSTDPNSSSKRALSAKRADNSKTMGNRFESIRGGLKDPGWHFPRVSGTEIITSTRVTHSVLAIFPISHDHRSYTCRYARCQDAADQFRMKALTATQLNSPKQSKTHKQSSKKDASGSHLTPESSIPSRPALFLTISVIIRQGSRHSEERVSDCVPVGLSCPMTMRCIEPYPHRRASARDQPHKLRSSRVEHLVPLPLLIDAFASLELSLVDDTTPAFDLLSAPRRSTASIWNFKWSEL